MHGREQLLITVDGLPRLTEMKSMKSFKRGLHRKHSYDAANNIRLSVLRSGNVVGHIDEVTRLPYIGPGYYWDG